MRTALVELTSPRIPCANFERFWGGPQLVERFTARGASGAYLRVLEHGDMGAGGDVEVVTQKHRLPELAPVLDLLPVEDQARLARKIATRLARTG